MSLPRITRAGFLLLGFAAALGFAARTTGAGWLMVLLSGVGGALVVSLMWSALSASRVRLTAGGPRDAVAGEPALIPVAARRTGLGVRLRFVDPLGPTGAVVGDGTAQLVYVPARRGLVDRVTVDVTSGAPFGLVWSRRRRTVALSRPIEVAPRRVSAPVAVPDPGTPDGEQPTTTGSGGDITRSLREYRPGDPMRLVHWPATARHGSVIVRELEQPEETRLHVVVHLHGDEEAQERSAEHALSVVLSAMEAGVAVTLHTREAAGPVSAPVASALDAGRRLARAVAGAPADPEHGGRVVRVGGGS